MFTRQDFYIQDSSRGIHPTFAEKKECVPIDQFGLHLHVSSTRSFFPDVILFHVFNVLAFGFFVSQFGSGKVVCEKGNFTCWSFNTSFVFPLFPVPLQHLLLIIGRVWLVGFSGPLICIHLLRFDLLHTFCNSLFHLTVKHLCRWNPLQVRGTIPWPLVGVHGWEKQNFVINCLGKNAAIVDHFHTFKSITDDLITSCTLWYLETPNNLQLLFYLFR